MAYFCSFLLILSMKTEQKLGFTDFMVEKRKIKQESISIDIFFKYKITNEFFI